MSGCNVDLEMKKQLLTRKIVAKLSGEHSAVAYASVKALVDKAVVLAPRGAENHVPITEIPVCRNRNFGDMTREARVSKRLKATTKDHLEIPKHAELHAREEWYDKGSKDGLMPGR
nr:PREDICTED: uncharacterized protein LOC108194463 [Daucus carota subsp. sativus]